MVDLREVLVLHVLQLRHQAGEARQALGVLDEVLLEVHHVLVGRLFRAVDVDVPEVLVLAGFDEGQVRSVG